MNRMQYESKKKGKKPIQLSDMTFWEAKNIKIANSLFKLFFIK